MQKYFLIPACNTREWTEALSLCCSYDTYHTSEYHLVAKQQGEGEPHLFFFRMGDDAVALPILLRQLKTIDGLDSSKCCDITSVYGYPGIITTIHANSSAAEEFRVAFQSSLYSCFEDLSVIAFFTRTNPLIDKNWLLEGAAEILNLSSTVAIDLTKSEKEQLGGMSKGHRYDIRKAYRNGVTAEEDTHFEYLTDFIRAYNETMNRVGALDYYFFSEDYYRTLKSILGDSLKLYVACFENRVVSASMFLVTGNIIQYHLSGTFSDCFSYNGAKVIIDAVRLWGSEHGYSWLHLGGGVGSAEDHLFRFKAGFSRQRFPFKIIRMIVNEVKYQQACDARNKWLKMNNHKLISNNYFPQYRAPVE